MISPYRNNPPYVACKLCGRDCAWHFLYVVFDNERQLFKVGMTKNINKRMKRYRQNGRYASFSLLFNRFAGCWYTASDRESRALRIVDKQVERVAGDWFRGNPQIGISAIVISCGTLRAKPPDVRPVRRRG